MSHELRNMAGEVRMVGDPGARMFTARVCNYGPVDTYGTSWAPGVFADSLRAGNVKSVWSHDWTRPIGKVISFTDTPQGLDVTVQLADFDAVPDARMAWSLLRDGIIDNFSFGFVRQAEEPDPSNAGAVRITKAILDEVSPVLVGSVPGTRTLAVRSATRDSGDVTKVEFDLTDMATELRSVVRAIFLEERALADPSTPTETETVIEEETEETEQTEPGTETETETERSAGPGRQVERAVDPNATDTEDDDVDPGTLAQAVDAAVDEAITLFGSVDTTTLPAPVQQAIALVQAADVAVDQLLDALGTPDPDEDVQNGQVVDDSGMDGMDEEMATAMDTLAKLLSI